jgi:DNA-binding NarL/FixJ family response regulator
MAMSRTAASQEWMLLVDDDADVREGIADLIRRRGCQVREAADGYAAIALIARHGPPCVVVTDLQMPQMNGFELIRALRAQPSTARTVIVAFSAATGDVPGATTVISKLEHERLVSWAAAHCGAALDRLDETSGT